MEASMPRCMTGYCSYEATMAVRITRRNKVIIDDSVNPIYRAMVDSHRNQSLERIETNNAEGLVGRKAILKSL